MTELFITLFCPVFIYSYLTQIQYNLCLIKRGELINDFSFKSSFVCCSYILLAEGKALCILLCIVLKL